MMRVKSFCYFTELQSVLPSVIVVVWILAIKGIHFSLTSAIYVRYLLRKIILAYNCIHLFWRNQKITTLKTAINEDNGHTHLFVLVGVTFIH